MKAYLQSLLVRFLIFIGNLFGISEWSIIKRLAYKEESQMSAGKLDLYIEQGTTWEKTLVLTNKDGVPLNLSNSIFRGQIRATTSSNVIAASFTFTVVNALNGTVAMSLTDTVTALIDAPRAYVYDVEMVTNGKVIRLLEGKVKVSPEVTK